MLSQSRSGLAVLALLLGAGPGCDRPSPTPESTPSSAATAATTPAALPAIADAIIDAAAPPYDRRPIALKSLVPSDDPDAGNAAPTGIVPDCENKLRQAGVTFRPI
jgi:hypothetical protein